MDLVCTKHRVKWDWVAQNQVNVVTRVAPKAETGAIWVFESTRTYQEKRWDVVLVTLKIYHQHVIGSLT